LDPGEFADRCRVREGGVSIPYYKYSFAKIILQIIFCDLDQVDVAIGSGKA
jgi:hypothetical protein